MVRSIAVRTDGTPWIWGGTPFTGSGILGGPQGPDLLDLESFKSLITRTPARDAFDFGSPIVLMVATMR